MSWAEDKARERFTPCYCGGQIREIWTRDKRTPYGWIRNHYQKPRWVIDNCIRALKSGGGKNG